METIFEKHSDIPLTENYIKQLHTILLRHSTKDERHRGEYNKHPNNVEALDENGQSVGIIFETTTPFETPGQSAAFTLLRGIKFGFLTCNDR